MRSFIFSSESVSEGHPDKIADQISDAIVDEILRDTLVKKRHLVRVACETMVKDDHVIIGGEYRLPSQVDDSFVPFYRVEEIVRETINDIGYDKPEIGIDGREYGFYGNGVKITNLLSPQSPDIAAMVDTHGKKKLGAGDQGIMFGYACNDTAELMPLPIFLAHELMKKHKEVRRALPWLRPDAKAQVSVRYDKGKPTAIADVVLSVHHAVDIKGVKVKSEADGDDRVRRAVVKNIIAPVMKTHAHKLSLPDFYDNKKCHINPNGIFAIGGPAADCGLTGRKVIVDTYGGWAPHGGGAFSGKDPTKVDRSAAYALRRVAKSIVAAELAERCLVQAAYAIGFEKPVSVMVDTDGTGDDKKLKKLIEQNAHFDLTPAGIIKELDLQKPIYKKTATYGHFGRPHDGYYFPWENTVKLGKREIKLLRKK